MKESKNYGNTYNRFLFRGRNANGEPMKETFILYTIHELEEIIGANTCEGYNTTEDTFIHIRVDKALDRCYFTNTK